MTQPVDLNEYHAYIGQSSPEPVQSIAIQWMRATAMAGILGSLIILVLFPLSWGSVSILAGVIWGITIGNNQRRFWQSYFPSGDWSKWAWFTTIGVTLGSLIFIALYVLPLLLMEYEDRLPYRTFLIPYIALLLLVGGVIFGASQWLLIRKYVRKAGWWVLAYALGCSIGGTIGSIIATSVYENLIPRNWKAGMLLGPAEGFYAFLAGTIATSVLSLTTGLALFWLLRQSNRHVME